ncbi:MAG: hypothetical protein LUI10_14090 [Lachnospiraceae bacterium]|nr:hypothetical protein [Lachnospiraceae bacterium]
MLKCYLAFTRKLWRVGMLLIAPLLLLVGLSILWFCTKWPGILAWSGLFVIWPLIVVIGDYFFFGGIYRMKENSLDYVKSSAKGVELVKNVVRMDCIQKLVWTALIYGTGCVLFCYPGILGLAENRDLSEVLYIYAAEVLYGFAGILLCTMICRFFMIFTAVILCAYGAAFLGFLSCFPAMDTESPMGMVLAFVCAIAVCVLNEYILKKKMGEMYYDQ